jgi:hypothetical protein
MAEKDASVLSRRKILVIKYLFIFNSPRKPHERSDLCPSGWRERVERKRLAYWIGLISEL